MSRVRDWEDPDDDLDDDAQASAGPGGWEGPEWATPVWTEIGREQGVLGEVLLRRRDTPDGPMVDLVVAGVLVMDDQGVDSERELATVALAELDGGRGRLGTPDEGGRSRQDGQQGREQDGQRDGEQERGLHVAVGGLGLGFTAAAVIADDRVTRCTVVEVEPAIVAWNRAGLVPATAGTTEDPRVDVVVGDITEVLPRMAAQQPGTVDVIALDVDNGPGFLVTPTNEALYGSASLTSLAALLRPGGVLAIWCAQPAVELGPALAEHVGPSRVHRSSIEREGRTLDYYVHLARRA